jgi:hypothetical protein
MNEYNIFPSSRRFVSHLLSSFNVYYIICIILLNYISITIKAIVFSVYYYNISSQASSKNKHQFMLYLLVKNKKIFVSIEQYGGIANLTMSYYVLQSKWAEFIMKKTNQLQFFI